MLFTITPFDNKARKWPYPFLGAASVSSDIEFTSYRFFEVLMHWLNTPDITPLGYGLEIEVSSSIFFYSANPECISVFKGTECDSCENEYAHRIADYIRAGFIDTNHCFGDFTVASQFTRSHAFNSYTWLSDRSLSLPIFTNHGGEANIHGIGAYDFRKGDDRNSPVYHSDLMQFNDVLFFWSETTSYEPVPNILRNPRKSTLRLLRSAIHRLPPIFKQPLFAPISLQDGTKVNQFWRFRGTGVIAPNFSSIRHQISTIKWKNLFRLNGAIILYQHLGVASKIGGVCVPMTVEAALDKPSVFLSPFWMLKDMRDSGFLWIAGLRRLLVYSLMIESTCIIFRDAGNVRTINISSPLEHGAPQRFYQGLTIYTNPSMRHVVSCGDIQLLYDVNGPDESGSYSISITAESLPSIW